MKIAVVDDEPLWQQKTVDVIENKYGLDAPHIDRYSSGRELLDRNTYYDILFMDIEMEGWMVLRQQNVIRSNTNMQR